ncbi:MAG: hypothetical protein H0X29_00770 [Parachlamydiaceae bacterium]|nr:hypothetical protein [Parachlamydiaceae bacterium]
MSVFNANHSIQSLNALISSEQYGYDFNENQKHLKQNLNEELKNHPIKNSVAIAWYSVHGGVSMHAAISIDDKPYGFLFCLSNREAKSLRASCAKRIGKLDDKVTVQYLAVNSHQREKIEAICQRRFFPCTSCMHSVARILDVAKVISIPFPINLMPAASSKYLHQLHTISHFPEIAQECTKELAGIRKGDLSKQVTYGSVKVTKDAEISEFVLALIFTFAFSSIAFDIVTTDSYPDIKKYVRIGCLALVAWKYSSIFKATAQGMARILENLNSVQKK